MHGDLESLEPPATWRTVSMDSTSRIWLASRVSFSVEASRLVM